MAQTGGQGTPTAEGLHASTAAFQPACVPGSVGSQSFRMEQAKGGSPGRGWTGVLHNCRAYSQSETSLTYGGGTMLWLCLMSHLHRFEAQTRSEIVEKDHLHAAPGQHTSPFACLSCWKTPPEQQPQGMASSCGSIMLSGGPVDVQHGFG